MKRIVNNRPICFFAISLAFGLFLTGFFVSYIYIRVLFITLSLILAGVLFLAKRGKFIYIPIAFMLGVFLISGVNDIYNTKRIELEDVEMSGTISTEIVESENGYYYFNVENIKVDGTETKKSATVYVWFLPEERAGQEIKFTGDIYTNDIDFRDFNAYAIGNDVYYRVYADSIEGLGEGNLKLSTRIKIKLKRTLYGVVDSDTADTFVALLLGDKYSIDDEFKESVKDAGLLHIFAVSGLHIGMFMGIMLLLAKLLKLKGIIKFLVVEIPLIFYAYICGFPSSVTRALIMSTMFLIGGMLGRQKDNLSILAFSAIIVLIVMPESIFQAGFHMSFSAVLGLIVLDEPIKKRLKFLPKRINEIVSGSLAVNIMLFPIMAGFFGAVQTLFIIANLIILPILPFIYGISLLMCMISLIIPNSAPMLVALNVIGFPIKFVSTLIGSLEISSISVSGLGILSIIYYAFIFIMSRYVFLPRTKRWIAFLTISSVVLAFVPLISLL